MLITELNEILNILNGHNFMELSLEDIKKHNDEIKKCGCACHQPDVELLHCFPCCSVTYQKPIQVEDE